VGKNHESCMDFLAAPCDRERSVLDVIERSDPCATERRDKSNVRESGVIESILIQ